MAATCLERSHLNKVLTMLNFTAMFYRSVDTLWRSPPQVKRGKPWRPAEVYSRASQQTGLQAKLPTCHCVGTIETVWCGISDLRIDQGMHNLSACSSHFVHFSLKNVAHRASQLLWPEWDSDCCPTRSNSDYILSLLSVSDGASCDDFILRADGIQACESCPHFPTGHTGQWYLIFSCISTFST